MHGEAEESSNMSYAQQQLETRLHQLENEIVALGSKQGESRGTMMNQPLNPKIMDVVPPEHLRIPAIKPYAGTADPMDHLDLFTFHMMVQDESDAMWCRVFLATLEGHERA